MRERWRITLRGTVQGVGFRPFVYQLATRLGVDGWVRNETGGVTVEAEGEGERLSRLLAGLVAEAPPLARVADVAVERLEPVGLTGFAILSSQGGTEVRALVPPDAALCSACRAELFDPIDRRHGYPFINCTHCGPRFTITAALPYDRPQTSMAAFPLCSDCAREYHDPRDRRFHAQPVACPACGPKAWYLRSGEEPRTDWREAAALDLARGLVVAVRGLGGFHLACDALNPAAVARLRQRKRRPHKPLAVMARDLEAVRRYCVVTPEEEALLTSPAAPIVLLRVREGTGPLLPDTLAPGSRTLGVMLPYTPLHVELFRAAETDLLVMTSGNRSGLPLARDNAQALADLGDVADGFLLHDREIVNRCDDSVVRVMAGGPVFFRRSRGYVPLPVPVPVPGGNLRHPVVLGAGGEMKNTFCLLAGGQAFLSQHIGELDTREGQAFYREALERLCRFLNLTPDVIAYDPHPGYQISRIARGLPGRHVAVQHHHAHLAAVLAEHGVVEEAVGIVLDGTGYGSDEGEGGRLWGGEVLRGDLRSCRRLAHLGYIPLPGGEAAIREPWRTGAALLHLAFGEAEALALAERLFPGRPVRTVLALIQRGLNTPLACGAGRWLDGAAALLGMCAVSTYEGHAAIALSDAAEGVAAGPYPWRVADGVIDLLPAVRALVADRLAGVPPAVAGARFQAALADAVAEAALVAGGRAVGRGCAGGAPVTRVALGGGAFQNPSLLERVRARLEAAGCEVLIPRQAPPGDGGLSLGQAVVALWNTRCGATNRAEC